MAAMKRSGAKNAEQVLRDEIRAVTRPLSEYQLRAVLALAQLVRTMPDDGSLPAGADRAVIDATVAAEVGRRWPGLVFQVFHQTHWSVDRCVNATQGLVRQLRAQIRSTDVDGRRAVDMIDTAAGYLHTSTEVDGETLPAGDEKIRRRLAQAHEALFGRAPDPIGMRAVNGILREALVHFRGRFDPSARILTSRHPELVLQRLIAVDAGFERLQLSEVSDLLDSFTPVKATRNSRKHSLSRIAAELIVRAGVFGAGKAKRRETEEVRKERVEAMRKRFESAMKIAVG
jgi:hypothetical protein